MSDERCGGIPDVRGGHGDRAVDGERVGVPVEGVQIEKEESERLHRVCDLVSVLVEHSEHNHVERSRRQPALSAVEHLGVGGERRGGGGGDGDGGAALSRRLRVGLTSPRPCVRALLSYLGWWCVGWVGGGLGGTRGRWLGLN